MWCLDWLASKPKLEFVILAIGLAIDGALGAWISVNVRTQSIGVWVSFLTGTIAMFVWAYLSRWSKMQIVMASLFFDLVYNVSWFATIILLGASMSASKWIGVALVMAGLLLLA